MSTDSDTSGSGTNPYDSPATDPQQSNGLTTKAAIAVVDPLDPRPIKKVSHYAFGTLLQGIGFALFICYLFPHVLSRLHVAVPIGIIAVGAVLTISSYSTLKRRYRIVEINQEGEQIDN